MATLQKAWFYNEYGPLDHLQFGDFPLPEIAPNQVFVKVLAAALNPIDSKRRQAFFKHTDSELPHVPGYDVAGIVIKVGSEVKELKQGDEVYGDLSEHAVNYPKRVGSLAQYTAVEEKLLALKPRNLSFAEAASLPLAVQTAQEAFDRAHFQPGQSVLIDGGAGGVGSLAIQLAKVVYGASLVATTASTGKIEIVKSLGADVVIDYTKSNYFEQPEKYDFVFDTIGDGENAVKAVKQGGCVLTINGKSKPPGAHFVLTSKGSNLARLAPYLETQKLKAVVDPKGPFPFSQTKEAFKYLETGRAVGKVVVAPVE